MRVLTVVGNRPQFVKAAAVSRHLRKLADEVLIHSGQHYDDALSDVFFRELGLPRPDHMLGVGSGSHAAQTGEIMRRLEPVAAAVQADAMLVYGDTNTTVAAALVGAKLPLPVVHAEAGLRSYEPSMPEEVNRVVADHVSRLLLCPTRTSMRNLEAEGLGGRARLVGDPMADLALEMGPVAMARATAEERFGLEPGAYLLATLHRQVTVDDADRLARACDALLAAADRFGTVVLPLHPRTRARLAEGGLDRELSRASGVRLADPLGYLDFSCLLQGARAVLTDSGGVQKEAYLAAVPCLTMREETEWPETLQGGWNRLVGLDRSLILAALEALGERDPDPPPDPGVYNAGRAAPACARALVDEFATAV